MSEHTIQELINVLSEHPDIILTLQAEDDGELYIEATNVYKYAEQKHKSIRLVSEEIKDSIVDIVWETIMNCITSIDQQEENT